jgi:NDP-sugar pyrophosphorylase family protein
MGVPSTALLLAAGLGTRLRPLTDVRAKAAIPVAGEPLARRIVTWLATNGATDLVVNLHHLPATLTAVLGDGSDMGARIRYSWEQPAVLGSAGGPRQALPLLGSDTFLIVNGDTLTDVDLTRLAAEHESSGAAVTLSLVPNREHLRYGGVVVDEGGAVTGFVPRGPAAAGSWHFIGAQIVTASVFSGLPAGRPARSIGGVYDELMKERPGSVRAFRSDAAFWDIGTVADYWRTSKAFEQNPTAAPAPIVWDNVDIGEGVTLEECIVTDNVRLPAGAAYRRSILMANAGGAVTAVPFDPSGDR